MEFRELAEKTLTIPVGAERTAVLGAADRNLKMIREALGVQIAAHNGRVVLRGDESSIHKAAHVIDQLSRAAMRRKPMSREEVLDAIVAPSNDAFGAPGIGEDGEGHPSWDGPLSVYASGRQIRPKTRNQDRYLEAIRTHDLVFGIGPAGTGKTYLAVAAAIHLLRLGRVKRLILARPAVEAGERLGFLPGDLQQKVNPYLRPLLDALGDMLDYATLQRFMANDVVEIVPLAFMRGRTLNDSVIILDEAQNTTVGQMLMFLTRMGHNSKCIVNGDPSQIDLESSTQSGLLDAVRRLGDVEGVAQVTLGREDIVRHRLVQRIVDAYGEAGAAAPAGPRGEGSVEAAIVDREPSTEDSPPDDAVLVAAPLPASPVKSRARKRPRVESVAS